MNVINTIGKKMRYKIEKYHDKKLRLLVMHQTK
jgi:hypothetical protein